MSDFFTVLDSNTIIERIARKKDLPKGAFSENARKTLALAVKQHQERTILDGKSYYITYRDDHVSVNRTNGDFTPCGTFYTSNLLLEWL